MEILTYFEQLSGIQWGAGITLLFVVWFLPAILAFFFNRKQLRIIAVACVPAGFSVIAWSGLMLWAVTGNALNRFRRAKA